MYNYITICIYIYIYIYIYTYIHTYYRRPGLCCPRRARGAPAGLADRAGSSIYPTPHDNITNIDDHNTNNHDNKHNNKHNNKNNNNNTNNINNDNNKNNV